jgi:DNA-binding XRE family transcriptional regulator
MQRSAVNKCLRDAFAALDPDSLIDVRYWSETDRIWVSFSDGVSGYLDWKSLGIADRLADLRLESVTIGSGSTTLELSRKNGELFEIDARSIKALLDAPLAKSIYKRGARSDLELGNRIKSARQKARLTQTELGEKIGIDQAILSKLERGRHQPRIDTLRRIADGLDLTVTELLVEEEPVAA